MHRRRGDAAGRWPLSRIFTLGAAVAAVVALTAIALGAVSLVRLSDARTSLLDVVAPMNLGFKDLGLALLNQETGVRGYALSKRPESRQPYDTGGADAQAAAATVRGFARQGGFSAVLTDMDALDVTVLRWRTTYAEPVLSTASAVDTGKPQFDEVRAKLAMLQSDIDVLRLAGRARLTDAANVVTGVGIAIAAVIAAFLAATAIGLRRGVLRPVSDLARQVREVVSGDVQQEVRAEGPREIVELGGDVDAMRVHILGEVDRAQEVNRRLDEQARELERSNRDLEQFAYVASHDLQEPLRKVGSFCQLLQRRYAGQLDERADQYIAFAVDGASRMQQLINDLLAFSRVGRTTAGFVPVALDEVAEAVRTQLETARAEVEGTLEIGPLPVVQGDAALLRQLLLNLVGNALKFHREGVPPVVRIDACRDGDVWTITVADNGIGIEQEFGEKVFVIFQRLHARDVYAGTGIGLALAKKIVEFHRGRIAVDDPGPEPGTTIRLTLPAGEQEDPVTELLPAEGT